MSDKKQVTGETVRSDDELVAELMAKTKAEGVDMVGENGLLSRLTKTTLENVLEAEMDEHLGYAKHERAKDAGGNARNGTRAKTVTTEAPSSSRCRATATPPSPHTSSRSASAACPASTASCCR